MSYEEQQTIATGKISKVLYEPDDENSKKIFQRLPEFCKCMLKKLRSSQLDKKLVKAKLKLISLLSSMILLNGSSKIVDDAAKLQKNTQCSESVAQGFLSRFFEVADMETSVSYTRSTAMQNKLKCHICVLALFLTDFEVDKEAFEALAGDFRVPAQLLGSYFMQTGCKVKQLKAGSNDTIVRLKAPVSFPKVKARQGGGAKRRY